MFKLKLFYKSCIYELVGRFPGKFVVSCPKNQVLEFSLTEAKGYHLFHKLLFFTVNNNSRRTRILLFKKGVGESRFEECYVVDRMVFHRGREVEFIIMRKDLPKDSKSAQFLFV